MKKAFVNGMVLIAIMMSVGITAFAQRVLGGYKTASTSDERVVAAAEFAVGQKAEEQEGLTLDSIEKAETQTVAGTNYRLCLKVSLEDETQEVKAVVFQNLKQEYSLTIWTVEDCAESESSESNHTGAITEEVRTSTLAHTKLAKCRSEQLFLREGEGEADIGGKRYGNYIFTNTSSAPCTLAGYPKFVLLNKARQLLRGVKIKYTDAFMNGSANENQSGNNLKSVTLAPGKTAWFQIFYNDGMALDHKKPFPVAAKVRVTAPNTARPFVVDSQIQACCGIQVSSIRNGSPQ
jgi:hypothetical protein